MAYTIVKDDNLEKTLKFELSAKDINSNVNKKLRKLQKTVKLQGYRKGKVPMSVMKQRYGAGAFQEAIEELLNEETDKMIDEIENIAYIGQHQIEPGENGDICTTVEIETFPDVSVDGYLGFEVTAPEIKVTEEEIESQLKYLQKQSAILEPVEHETIQESDVVMVSFHPISKTVDEVPDPQLSRDNFRVSLDENDTERTPLVIALAEALLGANKDEIATPVLPLTAFGFNQYGSDETCTLNVTIHSVNTLVLPEINDDLAKKAGNFSDLNELKEFITSELTKTKNDRRRHILQDQISEKLVERYDIELPTKFLNREIDGRLRSQLMQFGFPNADQLDLEQLLPNIEEARDSIRDNVTHQIRVNYLANKIFIAENLKVESQDFTDFALHQAMHSGTDPNAFLQYLNENPREVSQVASIIRVEKALDFLAENAEITEISEEEFNAQEKAKKEAELAELEKAKAETEAQTEENQNNQA